MSTGRSTSVRDQHRRAIARTKPPCGICEQPIDYSLRSPDPMSYEVDHVIPLARGGLDVLENKTASHRKCNRDKWHRIDRRVVLVCGPPGAGKTTHAKSTGLPVYDLDDPQWGDDDKIFREALALVAKNPNAQAVVIRAGATLDARRKAASMCGATEVVVIDTDLDTCIERIKGRRRLKQPIKVQIASAQDWWGKYEAGEVQTLGAGQPLTRTFVTERTW